MAKKITDILNITPEFLKQYTGKNIYSAGENKYYKVGTTGLEKQSESLFKTAEAQQGLIQFREDWGLEPLMSPGGALKTDFQTSEAFQFYKPAGYEAEKAKTGFGMGTEGGKVGGEITPFMKYHQEQKALGKTPEQISQAWAGQQQPADITAAGAGKTEYGQPLTLSGGQVISPQDPNYATYAKQMGITPAEIPTLEERKEAGKLAPGEVPTGLKEVEPTGTPAGEWIKDPEELKTLTKDDIAKLSSGKIFRRDLALEKQKIDDYRAQYGAPEADWQKFHDYAYEGVTPTTAAAPTPTTPAAPDIQTGLKAAQDRIARGEGTPEDKKNVEYAKGKGLLSEEGIADPKAEIESIDEEVNKVMEEEVGKIEETGVDVSKSAELTQKLIDMLEGDEEDGPPEAPSLEEQFNAKRAELGIEPLETELAGIDADIDLINTTLLVEAERAGEKLVSMAQIGRRRGKLQMEAEQKIALLNVQKNAISRQLSNKMNTLNTVMGLTQQDFANASTQYNNEFQKNLQLVNLISGIEQGEKADAQANLNTIINMAQKSGKGFGDLTPTMQRHINDLEIQQGLPPGVTSTFLTSKPNTKILSTSSGTDAAGNNIVTFIYEDPETGMPGTVEIVETGGVKKVGAADGGESGLGADLELTMEDINGIKEDIKEYGLTYVLTQNPDKDMQKVINSLAKEVKQEETEEEDEAEESKEFLTEDYLNSTLGLADVLRVEAENKFPEENYKKLFQSKATEKENREKDLENYISTEKQKIIDKINDWRSSGKSDKEIEKLLLKEFS